jgi:tetratricopeptide (TPR) repeat protein
VSVRFAALALVAGLLGPLCEHTTVGAQTAVGDSLWSAGRVNEAREAYEREITQDRLAVRANFRIAQTLAWRSNIDSALVLLRTARIRVPDDPDVRLFEATYLAWGRRFDESLPRFDSVSTAYPDSAYDYIRIAHARALAWSGRFNEARVLYEAILRRNPTERDAQFGLAQVSSWTGDVRTATRAYEALLKDDPDEPRVLIALASLKHRQGRSGTAQQLLVRSALRAPNDPEAATLRDLIRASAGPNFAVEQHYSDDSDGNANQWVTSSVRTSVGNMRSVLTLGSLAARDPARDSRRRLVEGTLSAPLGSTILAAMLGVRQLSPAWRDTPGGTTERERQVMTWRVSAAVPVSRQLSATFGAAHWPVDEIATLLGGSLDVDQQDVSIQWRPTTRLSVIATGNRLAYSDTNERLLGSLRLTYPLGKGFSVGAYGIGFNFAERSRRYFSPRAFRSAEATAVWAHEQAAWSASVSGGLGGQRVNPDRPIQTQWHAEARLTRRLTRALSVEAFGGRNTSAAASAVGAYRYDLLGIGLHLRPR